MHPESANHPSQPSANRNETLAYLNVSLRLIATAAVVQLLVWSASVAWGS
jgi:hypothetical protein